MTKRQRTTIFTVLTLAFFIITPVIILFSQGYLFDLKNIRLVQAGGIFIKSQPESTLITVQALPNGKPKTIQAKTSLLGSGGTLIKNLLPQKYLVSVRPAFQETVLWQKELEVNPLQVTKATRIIFPTQESVISSSTISSAALKLVATPKNNKDLFFYADNAEKVFRHESSTSTLIFDSKKITGFPKNEAILKILPSSSGKNFLALSKTNGIVFSNLQGIFLAPSFFKIFLQTEKISLSQLKFVWHENNDNILFALGPKNSYFFDLEKQNYAKFSDKKIIALTEQYFLDTNGVIYFSNYQDKAAEKEILDTKLKFANASISHLDKNSFIVKTDKNEIYLFDETTGKKITPNVKELVISQDKSRLAYLDENDNIFVYFLEDVFDDLLYEKGETVSLGQAEDTKNIYFTHYNWQIVTIQNQDATILEIDKRSPINTQKIYLDNISAVVDFNGQIITWIDKNILKTAKILP